MKKEQRKFLADKLAGSANIILGGLVIGQFISGRQFEVWLFLTGLMAYVVLLIVSLLLLKEGDENGT